MLKNIVYLLLYIGLNVYGPYVFNLQPAHVSP